MTDELQRFGGGVAVITGAGSGIGEGLARHAASLGMKVVLADIAAARIEAIAEELRAGGAQAMAVPTDVCRPESIERLADTVYSAWGEVRLLVNNAGVEMVGFAWELPAEEWDKILDVNIRGVVHGVRVFAPRMIASGTDCVIANLSSIGGLGIMPLQTSYVMSKHAVLSFTEGLSLEMKIRKAQVQVSAILPGPVITRIFADADIGADPVSRHHRAAMQAMLEQNGIPPAEAATRIFAQLAAGNFWVSTHPDMTRAMAEGRAQYLCAQQAPALDGGMLGLLGLEG